MIDIRVSVDCEHGDTLWKNISISPELWSDADDELRQSLVSTLVYKAICEIIGKGGLA